MIKQNDEIQWKSTHNQKILRLKYVRVLEKFVKRTIALLKHPEFDYVLFKELTFANYEFVQKLEAIRLDSEYLKKLQEYSQIILNTIANHSKDFKDEQQFLLKEANLLHKEKNKNNYKKDKHKKKKFNDGY
ncbi:MAG: hypothetical protein KAQ94_09765 [Arcobacteraceae bacterium]|nr:hypothetical protein [Arcobacteraceae bacterium]